MVHLKTVNTIPLEALRRLANNNSIAQNLRDAFPHPYTAKDANDFIRLAGQGILGHVFGVFNENTFIGVGSIVPKQDIYRNNGEIGYWIGETYWGNGHGSKTVELLTDYAFKELHLLRVFATVFSNNKASMKVLEKSGYTLEAVLKSSLVKNGTILDEHIYSRLNTFSSCGI